MAANAAVALVAGCLHRSMAVGPIGTAARRKQARRLAVPGGSCGGLLGVPSSLPPTACLGCGMGRVRASALDAEGNRTCRLSWVRGGNGNDHLACG